MYCTDPLVNTQSTEQRICNWPRLLRNNLTYMRFDRSIDFLTHFTLAVPLQTPLLFTSDKGFGRELQLCPSWSHLSVSHLLPFSRSCIFELYTQSRHRCSQLQSCTFFPQFHYHPLQWPARKIYLWVSSQVDDTRRYSRRSDFCATGREWFDRLAFVYYSITMVQGRGLVQAALLVLFLSTFLGASDAVRYIVGGDAQWSYLHPDSPQSYYSDWAANKIFSTGDTLGKFHILHSLQGSDLEYIYQRRLYGPLQCFSTTTPRTPCCSWRRDQTSWRVTWRRPSRSGRRDTTPSSFPRRGRTTMCAELPRIVSKVWKSRSLPLAITLPPLPALRTAPPRLVRLPTTLHWRPTKVSLVLSSSPCPWLQPLRLCEAPLRLFRWVHVGLYNSDSCYNRYTISEFLNLTLQSKPFWVRQNALQHHKCFLGRMHVCFIDTF